MKNALLFISFLFITACTPVTSVTPEDPPATQVNSFEECVAAGNPVMESYPRQCRHGDRTFTEVIDEGPDLKEICEEAGGKWLPDSNECEGISRESCEAAGGTFNECASACRNDPEAEICTLQCVLVCQF